MFFLQRINKMNCSVLQSSFLCTRGSRVYPKGDRMTHPPGGQLRERGSQGWLSGRSGEAGRRGAVLFRCSGLRTSKQSRIYFFMRTEPPLNAPSMALRGFRGHPVREFLELQGLLRSSKSLTSHKSSAPPSSPGLRFPVL